MQINNYISYVQSNRIISLGMDKGLTEIKL